MASATTSAPTHANGESSKSGVKGQNGVGSKNDKPTSKNAKRRQKRKEQKETATNAGTSTEPETSTARINGSDSLSALAAPSTIDFTEDGPILDAYAEVFARFQAEPSVKSRGDEADGADVNGKGEVIYSDDDQLSESEEENEANKRLSKRKQRQLRRLTVAELKQMVKKPELVDWEDVTATDPQLLIQLKSTRNTIPVPPHWNLKRDYLQNKKGFEKPPFQLPPYIAATGIAEIKDALKEKESEQTLKAKTRERVQPKMGKVVIDYQKLHDAFFRFQTKPESLTRFGEVYYEGKEFEKKFKERKPGELSNELKEALSIPPLAPPPWLIAMQRFGLPPSYPQLRIPGLNAPIPEGAQWGFHPGGWGRPPMDEYGNPLFGNVLGQAEQQQKADIDMYGQEPEKEHFGELEPEEEAEESESESEEDDEDEEEEESERQDVDRRGLETPVDGLETPGGIQSVASTVPGGLETPGFLELRKGARAGAAEGSGAPPSSSFVQQGDRNVAKQLYQVLPERQVSGGQGFLSGDHGYDISRMADNAAQSVPPTLLGSDDARGTKRKANDLQGSVDVSLDASELEGLSDAQLAQRYEAARQAAAAEQHGGGQSDADRTNLALLREELQRKRTAKEAKRAGAR